MNKSARKLYGLIENIRQRRESNYQDELSDLRVIENLLGHVGENLYSTEFHFILELIQNAVDSSSNSDGTETFVKVRFHLKKDNPGFVASNNGLPFLEVGY